MARLTDQQRIGARLMAAGVSHVRIAERLGLNANSVGLWKKKKHFRTELDFWRRKGAEIFEDRMEQLLNVGADRVTDILLDGRDNDALTAFDKVMRATGKYKDKIIVEKETPEEDPIEQIKNIVEDINNTLGITNTGVGKKDSKAQESRRPRQLDKSNSV